MYAYRRTCATSKNQQYSSSSNVLIYFILLLIIRWMCYQQEYKCMINMRMQLRAVSYDTGICLKSSRKTTNNLSKESRFSWNNFRHNFTTSVNLIGRNFILHRTVFSWTNVIVYCVSTFFAVIITAVTCNRVSWLWKCDKRGKVRELWDRRCLKHHIRLCFISGFFCILEPWRWDL